jgi:hypothetical protein
MGGAVISARPCILHPCFSMQHNMGAGVGRENDFANDFAAHGRSRCCNGCGRTAARATSRRAQGSVALSLCTTAHPLHSRP